ncbi:hypothetical protein K491DRAFT_685292 [Lophiostoma macrostomum CBS 122681]|uniref:Uncharacterized protein n=1 Tax=Lophiostoma macrostomum CBS 122681 TaxID=1314788 RepID=A0A6A6SN06_9PLEO|nr:hypothetical protein K491DRAFT_685292 [Lophiostoma macrostomum CBS 122681]
MDGRRWHRFCLRACLTVLPWPLSVALLKDEMQFGLHWANQRGDLTCICVIGSVCVYTRDAFWQIVREGQQRATRTAHLALRQQAAGDMSSRLRAVPSQRLLFGRHERGRWAIKRDKRGSWDASKAGMSNRFGYETGSGRASQQLQQALQRTISTRMHAYSVQRPFRWGWGLGSARWGDLRWALKETCLSWKQRSALDWYGAVWEARTARSTSHLCLRVLRRKCAAGIAREKVFQKNNSQAKAAAYARCAQAPIRGHRATANAHPALEPPSPFGSTAPRLVMGGRLRARPTLHCCSVLLARLRACEKRDSGLSGRCEQQRVGWDYENPTWTRGRQPITNTRGRHLEQAAAKRKHAIPPDISAAARPYQTGAAKATRGPGTTPPSSSRYQQPGPWKATSIMAAAAAASCRREDERAHHWLSQHAGIWRLHRGSGRRQTEAARRASGGLLGAGESSQAAAMAATGARD